MSNSEKCPICREKFGFFLWRYECYECGTTICDDCSEEYGWYTRERTCNRCKSSIDEGTKDIKVVTSDHIGGHNIVKTMQTIKSQVWFRNPQRAVDNLKYQAHKMRANAILGLSKEKDTHSESGSSDNGTHYYSVFKASGKVAIVEKKIHKNKNSRQNKSTNNGGGKPYFSQKKDISKELDKLIAMKEKDYLTEEEFRMAKAKLLK